MELLRLAPPGPQDSDAFGSQVGGWAVGFLFGWAASYLYHGGDIKEEGGVSHPPDFWKKIPDSIIFFSQGGKNAQL